MSPNASAWRYALLFLTFLSISLAASPTSFCKCVCFTNSTIIPLNDIAFSSTSFSATSNSSSDDSKRPSRRTCNDCNKQFCLSYNLAICQEAEEKDVLTTCFQRDSTKDMVVIYLFILATVGLLGWAGLKPWWERWRERASYRPVGMGRQ